VQTTQRTGPGLKLLLLLIVLLLLAAGLLTLFGWGGPPRIEVKASKPGIGPGTPVRITVHGPARGIPSLKVTLAQGDHQEVLVDRQMPVAPAWKVWARGAQEETLELMLGRSKQPWLRNGEATLHVEAGTPGGLLRHPAPAVEELKLPVRVYPPSVQVVSTQTYAAQGGAEAVVYRVDAAAAKSGVRAGSFFFPGSPLPGQAGTFFCIFGIPYDLTDPTQIQLVAEDALGNEAHVTFVEKWTPRKIAESTIKLTDPFLQKAVPEIASHTPDLGATDDLLATYLKINGELRRKNAAQLLALGPKSREEFLWKDAFLPFPNGQVMEAFAARRTYLYNDKKVDEQTHLGFDLASTQHAPVPAANRGVVLMAEYFGIYGNCIVLDHGYGVMSLYAHLASFDVKPGDTVERGQKIGVSDSTGLAGGDHLHFAILVRGMPVTPVEWWDPHWIQDRIGRKLGNALPYMQKGGAAAPAPPGPQTMAAPAAKPGGTGTD
jgi:murein DD-endopeptidase MepM/ murein hydrolase activator NlpD